MSPKDKAEKIKSYRRRALKFACESKRRLCEVVPSHKPPSDAPAIEARFDDQERSLKAGTDETCLQGTAHSINSFRPALFIFRKQAG